MLMVMLIDHKHLRGDITSFMRLSQELNSPGCACVLIPTGYLEGIFKHGGLDYMDAVVLHPYRGMPEGVEEEVAEVEELIHKYNNGRDKPIWVTETGKYSHEGYDWEEGKGMDEKGRRWVARYLVRQYVLLLIRNVEKIYWYLMRDYHNFVTMGLVRKPDDPLGRYAVAPAYVAYATLIRQLDGAKYVQREAIRPYTRAYVQLFRRGEEEIRVCWATHPSEISIKTQIPINVVNIVGREETLIPEAGMITLAIDENPVYVKGKFRRWWKLTLGPRCWLIRSSTIAKVRARITGFMVTMAATARGKVMDLSHQVHILMMTLYK
jgi:hypothetical protein